MSLVKNHFSFHLFRRLGFAWLVISLVGELFLVIYIAQVSEVFRIRT